MGNYNFVTPYSHETTHGVALSVACFVLLCHGLIRRSRWACAAAGVCFGLVLLTKPEIAAAAGAGVFAGWLAAYSIGDADRQELAVGIPLFIMLAAVPPFLFFLYFATQMEMTSALRATAGAWAPLVRYRHYQQRVLSLEHGHRHPIAECWTDAARVCRVRCVRSVLPSAFRGRVPTGRRGRAAGDFCEWVFWPAPLSH